MAFTKEEKKLIRMVLEKHLEEVRKVEKMPDQMISLLSAEVKYEDFIKGILKKL